MSAHFSFTMNIMLNFVSSTKCYWKYITKISSPTRSGLLSFVFSCRWCMMGQLDRVWGHPVRLCPRCVSMVRATSVILLSQPRRGNHIPVVFPMQTLQRSKLSLWRYSDPLCTPNTQHWLFLMAFPEQTHILQAYAHSTTLILPLIPACPPALAHLYIGGLFSPC